MRYLFTLCSLVLTLGLMAQSKGDMPSVTVKTLDGKSFNTANIENNGKPIIIKKFNDLKTIHDIYPDWQDETDVVIYAVSIDDSRNVAKVGPYVNSRAWDYKILLDSNGDLARAMNVTNPPHTFVLNAKKEIVWQHNGYAAGDEEELYEVITKVANGEEL